MEVGEGKPRSYSGDYMAEGRLAEEIAIRWLRSLPGVEDVQDLRDDGDARRDDVDFRVSLTGGRTVTVEVKSDAHLGQSGNVLFEVLRINHTAPHEAAIGLGWSARSTADWFLYYAPVTQELYLCKVKSLREAVQQYTKAARNRTRFGYVATDNIKSTVNILVPWGECKDAFKVFPAGHLADPPELGTNLPLDTPREPCYR